MAGILSLFLNLPCRGCYSHLGSSFPCLVSAAWGIHRASCLWRDLSDVLTLIHFVFLVVLRLSSPLPPSFRFFYSFRVLNLGCKNLCIVSSFQVLILSFLSGGFYLLWPIHYTSRVSGDWLGVGVYCLEVFFFSLFRWLHTLSFYLKVFGYGHCCQKCTHVLCCKSAL